MSPNSDNAMARFLFAILKQKSLKDVSHVELQPCQGSPANQTILDRLESGC
jgi:hypothetical protein